MKTRPASSIQAVARLLLALTLVGIWGVQPVWGQQTAPSSYQLDIAGPPGSEWFGDTVTALPNGNIVVTDPYYDAGAVHDVGAAYLYDGGTGALISMLTGTTEYDQVGVQGVTVLANGNFLVRSAAWNNGPAAEAGAATWGSGTTGITGTVSAANSLVGSTAYDGVGEWVTALPNGHYVVGSQFWNNGTVMWAGAVTWGNGTIGTAGPVSAANSLVGSSAGDRVGGDEVTVLTNGNYVVRSPSWNNGAASRAGAVTWGTARPASPARYRRPTAWWAARAERQGWLAGGDAAGQRQLRGEQLVWDNGAAMDAGAATWGNGTTGITGAVSAANSLVGSRANDKVGAGVTALSNGNYVVSSPQWNNGAVFGAGAATWGDGTTGITGTVSVANSLVGSSGGDGVGSHGVTALTNGNYVVRSRWWETAP